MSGAPERAGASTFTAHLTDATGATADVHVRLVVRQRLVIAASALRAASVGHTYSAKIVVRGGVEGKQWGIIRGALPRGLQLNAATGTVFGTPRSAGSFRFTVRVRDALGALSTKTLSLTVH